MDEDLRLRLNGGRYMITERAFRDLCGLLRVPFDFAQEIPTDLAAAVVKRLASMRQHVVVPCCRDETVVAVVDPAKWAHHRSDESNRRKRPLRYEPLPSLTILDLIEKIWKDESQTLQITLSDTRLAVELVHVALEVQPKVGDVKRAGVRITSSETGGPMPVAHGFTLRLICNPAGGLSTDPRVRLEHRVEKWVERLAAFVPNLDLLRPTYVRMAEDYLLDRRFYELYRDVSYIYRQARKRASGDDDVRTLADQVLGVEADARREVIHTVRVREKRIREGEAVQTAPERTEFAVWDVFNSITATARGERLQRRMDLEKLAGKLLADYGPAPN